MPAAKSQTQTAWTILCITVTSQDSVTHVQQAGSHREGDVASVMQAQQEEILHLREQRETAIQFGLAAETELQDVEGKLQTALNSLDGLRNEVLYARDAEGHAFDQLNAALSQLRSLQDNRPVSGMG